MAPTSVHGQIGSPNAALTEEIIIEPHQQAKRPASSDVRGNTSVCAEFNFLADPEAAHIVLNRFHCPTYIASWEFACENMLPWSFCDAWLAQDSDKARFMKKIFRHTMEAAQTERYRKEMVAGTGFASCDSYAVAAAIAEGFVTESERVAVTVELQGAHTRGMMVLDTLGLLKKQHHVSLLRKVDLDMFKNMLMDALK